MKMFSQVLIPGAQKGMEYIVTGEVNNILSNGTIKEGPYLFIQEAKKGAGKRIKKANFKAGTFYHHSEVILAS